MLTKIVSLTGSSPSTIIKPSGVPSKSFKCVRIRFSSACLAKFRPRIEYQCSNSIGDWIAIHVWIWFSMNDNFAACFHGIFNLKKNNYTKCIYILQKKVIFYCSISTYESCKLGTFVCCSCVVDWINPNGNFFIVFCGLFGMDEIPIRMIGSRLFKVTLWKSNNWCLMWIELNVSQNIVKLTMFRVFCYMNKHIHSKASRTRFRLPWHGNMKLLALLWKCLGINHGKSLWYIWILHLNSTLEFDRTR